MPSLNYERRIPQVIKSIENSNSIKENNEKIIKKYLRDLRVRDYSEARIYKILSHMKKICEEIDFDLETATEDNIKEMVAWVNSRKLADATKRDYKVIIKQFYKWFHGDGQNYPDSVKWINTTLKTQNNSLPENMLIEDDIKDLLQQSKHTRDKALISMLWETGARIGELIDLKIGSLEDHKHGLKVVISGKTGPRRLLLISCVPHLRSWLNSHPDGDDPESPLWVNIGNTNFGDKLRYRTILKLLNETADRADINKPMNPHHFRHSRATYLASKFTEAQMNEWFGWVQGSDQPQRYVHLSGRDMDGSYAKIHGIKDEETDEESTLAPKDCPRCGNSVPPDAKFCYKCGMALSLEAAREIEEDEQESAEKYSEVVKKDPDALEDMQDFMEMLRLIRSDDELMDDLNNLVREKRRS